MSDELTEAELNAIEARAAAATEGPWEKDRWDGTLGRGSLSVPSKLRVLVTRFNYGNAGSPDLEFIAAARTDVPRLVKALREARAEIVRLRTGET